MTDYLLLFVGTVLVNNFVLVKFLGLCLFMGVSKSWRRQWAWAGNHLRDDDGLHLRMAD